MRFRRLQFHPRPLPARSHLPSSSPRTSTPTVGLDDRGLALIRSFLTLLSGMKLPEAQTFFDREIERVGDLLARRAFKVRLASVSFLPRSERTSMRATGNWSRPSNMSAG